MQCLFATKFSRRGHKSTKNQTIRKHSSRMCADCTVTRPSSEPVSMRPIVDRPTPVKTLPSLAAGNKGQSGI